MFSVAIAGGSIVARADDFGPARAVGAVRHDARILLMRTARTVQANPDPRISNVLVVGDEAVASWDAGSLHGLIGLERYLNRWWEVLMATRESPTGTGWYTQTSFPLHEAYDRDDCSPPSLRSAGFSEAIIRAVFEHNKSLVRIRPPRNPKANLVPGCTTEWVDFPISIEPSGGRAVFGRQDKPLPPDYRISLTYTKNNARPKALFAPTYMRAPTAAEMLPNPTPYYSSQNAVCFFDLRVDTSKPVTFAAGSTLEVWFPFVLDDKIRYDLTLAYAGIPIQPIFAKPFDNTLRFSLPAITITPGKPVMAEIDGGD